MKIPATCRDCDFAGTLNHSDGEFNTVMILGALALLHSTHVGPVDYELGIALEFDHGATFPKRAILSHYKPDPIAEAWNQEPHPA